MTFLLNVQLRKNQLDSKLKRDAMLTVDSLDQQLDIVIGDS